MKILVLPGVLVERIDALGLEVLAAPKGRIRPSPAPVRDLRSLVRARGIDVVHGYEWPPAVTALLATRGTPAVPAAGSVRVSHDFNTTAKEGTS